MRSSYFALIPSGLSCLWRAARPKESRGLRILVTHCGCARLFPLPSFWLVSFCTRANCRTSVDSVLAHAKRMSFARLGMRTSATGECQHHNLCLSLVLYAPRELIFSSFFLFHRRFIDRCTEEEEDEASPAGSARQSVISEDTKYERFHSLLNTSPLFVRILLSFHAKSLVILHNHVLTLPSFSVSRLVDSLRVFMGVEIERLTVALEEANRKAAEAASVNALLRGTVRCAKDCSVCVLSLVLLLNSLITHIWLVSRFCAHILFLSALQAKLDAHSMILRDLTTKLDEEQARSKALQVQQEAQAAEIRVRQF